MAKKASNKPKAVSVSKPTNQPSTYKPTQYKSQYQTQLDKALNNVVNFNYDPLQDASYRALANLYNEQGNRAAADTLGQAASLNGGYGTSFGVSAAQQARNQYNQELASMIPDMEDRAYSRATGSLGALRDADNTNYARFRDNVGDNQWAYEQQYQQYRDAMADYEWGKGYNLDRWSTVQQLKKAKSSGGGRHSSRGSGGGSSYSGGNNSGGNQTEAPQTNEAKMPENPNLIGMWAPGKTYSADDIKDKNK